MSALWKAICACLHAYWRGAEPAAKRESRHKLAEEFNFESKELRFFEKVSAAFIILSAGIIGVGTYSLPASGGNEL